MTNLMANLFQTLANWFQAIANWFNRGVEEDFLDEIEEVIDDIVVIPEPGTPERVKYFVAIRDEAVVSVKEARMAHQAVRANR